MSRPRKGPPLPAPFNRPLFRHQLCAQSHVCEATVCKWAAGVQTVGEHHCRALALACQSLGVVPPLAAKVPPPIGSEPAKPHLRALS